MQQITVNNINSDNYLSEELEKKSSIQKNTTWTTKVIQILNESNQKLEAAVPSNRVQTLIDNFYTKRLLPLMQGEKARAFQTWLESNGEGEWYKKLATCLLKLPLRSVRDILEMVYHVLKASIYGLVHPLKSLNETGLFFMRLIEALKRSETYTALGAGMLGSSLGIYAVTGLYAPTAVGFAVGALFLGAGICFGAIRIANRTGGFQVTVKRDRIMEHLKLVPQAFTTGFLTGVVFGAICRVPAEKLPATKVDGKPYLNLKKYWL